MFTHAQIKHYSLLMLIYRTFTRWIDYNVSHISILIPKKKYYARICEYRIWQTDKPKIPKITKKTHHFCSNKIFEKGDILYSQTSLVCKNEDNWVITYWKIALNLCNSNDFILKIYHFQWHHTYLRIRTKLIKIKYSYNMINKQNNFKVHVSRI